MDTPNPSQTNQGHIVYVVSGSIGTGGERITRKVMSQFREVQVDLKVISHVHRREQLVKLVDEAATTGGTVVNTLVNPEMSQILFDLAAEKNVVVIDIVTDLINRLASVLNMEPTGKPGLYRDMHADYFKRIEAINFSLAHDDGMNYSGWSQAEIVLVGVSRVGKTPLSVYLSMLGWKVANVPIVMDMPPRKELFELNHRTVIGLTIDPTQLMHYRQNRQQRLGLSTKSDYCNLVKIYEEIDVARQVFRRGNFRVLNVTHMPIEASADKIVKWITQY